MYATGLPGDDEIRLDRVWALVARRLAVLLAGLVVIGLLVTALPVGARELVGRELLDRPPPVDESVAGPTAAPAMPAPAMPAPAMPAPLSEAEWTAMTRLATAATFRVTGSGCGSSVTGSGFAIDGALVTNAHVAAKGATVQVDRGRLAPLRWDLGGPVLVSSAAWDLSLAPSGFATPLTVRVEPPPPGEPVMLAGFGGGRALSLLSAQVHALVDGAAYGSEGPVMLLRGATAVGFSGGPVLDRRGEVVAVLRGYDPVTELTVAVPGANIVQLVTSVDMDHVDAAC